MDFVDFNNIVETMKSSNPKLFELEYDAECSDSEIADIEKIFAERDGHKNEKNDV